MCSVVIASLVFLFGDNGIGRVCSGPIEPTVATVITEETELSNSEYICKVGPGEQHFSDYITMADGKKIDRVYVAVHKVKYSDGTIKTVNYHDYSYWEID